MHAEVTNEASYDHNHEGGRESDEPPAAALPPGERRATTARAVMALAAPATTPTIPAMAVTSARATSVCPGRAPGLASRWCFFPAEPF